MKKDRNTKKTELVYTSLGAEKSSVIKIALLALNKEQYYFQLIKFIYHLFVVNCIINVYGQVYV